MDGEAKGRRFREVKLVFGPGESGPLVASSKDVARFLQDEIGSSLTERFVVLGLDARHRVLGWSLVAVGSVRACPVLPADVFRPVVAMGAHGLICSHNHPSGDASPSGDDRELTKRLVEGGRLLGLAIVDHLVVSATGYVSFVDAGLLPSGGGA